MASELNETSENPDQAAMDAVSSFFKEGDREELAGSEAGYSAPVYGESQQQSDELEQEELSDPSGRDDEPSEPADKDTKTEPSEPAPAAPETVSEVDDELRAVAKGFGWSDEKIDRLVKADPELAKETFETFAAMHAEQARQYLAPNPGSQPALGQNSPALPAATSPQSAAIPPELSDDSLKKFAEENGEQAANVIRTIRDQLVSRSSALEQRLLNAEAFVERAIAQSVAAEAETALSGLAGKHPDLYGTPNDPGKTTVLQQKRLDDVIRKADEMRNGAAQRGIEIPVAQALSDAHYIVSKDSVKTEARREVVAEVKKRAKQVTARPTARTNPEGKGFKRSDASAAEAYSRRMSELGIE